MQKIVVERIPHSPDCAVIAAVESGEWNPPLFIDDFFWGNRIGTRQKKGNWHRWLNVRCNDANCIYEAIVNADWLSEQTEQIYKKLKENTVSSTQHSQVKSRSDSDIHFISAEQLIRLYGVDRRDCIIDTERGGQWALGHPKSELEKLKHLYPRQDGDYRLVES